MTNEEIELALMQLTGRISLTEVLVAKLVTESAGAADVPRIVKEMTAAKQHLVQMLKIPAWPADVIDSLQAPSGPLGGRSNL